MATQRNGTVFSNILNVLRGNRTGLDAEKNREKLLTNQPSTPYKAIEDKQQEFLDVQSSKIAYDLYSRSVYYDTDRLTAYNDFKAMDTSPEISAALDILTDEICTRSEKGEILQIFSNNARIKNVLKDLFQNILNIDYNLMFWSREMMKYGDFFLKLEIDKDAGIFDCRAMPQAELHREEAYDGNMNSARFRWDLNNMYFEEWQVAHFRIATDGSRLPYGRCLKWDTYIETETGVKFIKDIIPGKDKVYSFDTKTQKRILSDVLDKIFSGKKEIYKIRTKNNELESSIEHKIMIYDKNMCDFKYKYVSELNIGDLFVINKKTETNNLIKINKEIYEDINKNGYRKNLNLIPEYVDEEFAMLFGFMLGDGWINNNNVCFALGVENDVNEKYVNLLEKFSGNKVSFVKNKNQEGKLYFSQVTCGSKMLKKILQKNGFIGNVYSKRFPEWIFNAEKNIQEAFMKGLYEADGSISVDKWNCKRYSLELTNEYMVKDAKVLLQRLGKKSGKLSSRNRDKTIFWNKEVSKKESFYFYYYDSEIKQKQKYDILNRLTDNFIIEPITSIEKTSKLEDVYDIHVENENHNFYANGIVVHNSILEPARKLWKQLQLAEDAMLVYRLIRAPERRVYYIEVGNTDPKDIPQFIEKMKASMKKNYVVDPNTGQMNLKYSPITYEEDYFIPVRGDKSSKIETLQGASNLNDIADVEYLQNKLFAAIKVPRTYLNYADKLEGGSTLAQADLRFARTVNRMQEAMLLELRRIANIHLYFLGFEDDMDNFSLKLTNPSTQQELLKLEVTKLRLEVFKEMYNPEITSPTSYTYAMQNVLGFSEAEIKLILKQKKVEKKMFAEIDEAAEIYKKTGIFKDIDKKFTKGQGDEEDAGVSPGGEENEEPSSGGGGGGFSSPSTEDNPFGGEAGAVEGGEGEAGAEGAEGGGDGLGAGSPLSESTLLSENTKLFAKTKNLLKNLDKKFKVDK